MNQCPICKVNQPFECKLLPCNVVICSKCAQSIYDRNGKVFGCDVCHSFHDMPKAGFPSSSTELFQPNNDNVRRESHERLQMSYALTIFNELEQQTTNSKFNGRTTLKDYFQDLRNQVNRETEIALQAIHQANESLINEINSFERQKEKEYDDVFYEWLKSIEINRRECDKIANNDEKLLRAVEFTQQFKSNFALSTIENKIFKGVYLKFQKNPALFDTSVIGTLKLQKIKSIDFNVLNKFSLKSVLNDVDQTALNTIRIVPFDNGNIFVTHQMANKYYKYSVLNASKNLEGITLDEKYVRIISCHQKNNYVFIYSETEESFMMKVLDHRIQKSMASIYFKKLVGVNDAYLYCISNKPANKPLYVYNWKLQHITSLGQRDNPKRAFYFPSNILQIDNRDGKYIWLNDSSLNIANELNGTLVNSISIQADKFQVDSNNNLVLMCKSIQKLVYYNLDGYLLQEIELYNFPQDNVEFFLDKYDKVNFFVKTTLELCETS